MPQSNLDVLMPHFRKTGYDHALMLYFISSIPFSRQMQRFALSPNAIWKYVRSFVRHEMHVTAAQFKTFKSPWLALITAAQISHTYSYTFIYIFARLGRFSCGGRYQIPQNKRLDLEAPIVVHVYTLIGYLRLSIFIQICKSLTFIFKVKDSNPIYNRQVDVKCQEYLYMLQVRGRRKTGSRQTIPIAMMSGGVRKHGGLYLSPIYLMGSQPRLALREVIRVAISPIAFV